MAVKKKKAKKRVVRKKITKKRVVKRKPVKKAVRKAQKPRAKQPKAQVIGIITHYFPKVRAGVIKLKAPLSVGDTIRVKGYTTDFTQNITSLQVNHVPVNSAKKGAEIGLLVKSRVRGNDTVYKE